MAETPPDKTKDKTSEPPAPEVLKPQEDNSSATPETKTAAHSAADSAAPKTPKKPRHVTYRPSHKATFIGLGVVVAVLAINAVVIAFVMRGQGSAESALNREEVILSTETLDKLGVSRNPVGNEGTELIIGPDSQFNGKVSVAGDVSVAGQLKLNSKLTVAEASITKLDAGDTSLGQLNVNGDGTITSLTLRKDLNVAGASHLQGSVTINQSLSVVGNVAIGGVLSARTFQASTLASGSVLSIGGHMISRGAPPGVSAGGAVGSNGTVSISGNDISGTVAVNVGTGAGSGTLASVSFRDRYGKTPHVIITPVGRAAPNAYVNRSSTGFSIATGSGLSPGGYAFDYIVME